MMAACGAKQENWKKESPALHQHPLYSSGYPVAFGTDASVRIPPKLAARLRPVADTARLAFARHLGVIVLGSPWRES